MEYYQIFCLNATKGDDTMKKYSARHERKCEKRIMKLMSKLGVKNYYYDKQRKECFIFSPQKKTNGVFKKEKRS